MKNFAKVSVLAVFAVISLFAFTGCKAEAPVEDPSVLLQQSIYNLSEVSSLRYSATLAADVPSTSVGGDISADFSLNGAFNHTAEKKSNVEMTAVANMKDPDNQKYRIDFSIREVSDKIYIQLLEAPSIPGLAADGFKDFVKSNCLFQIAGETVKNIPLNIILSRADFILYDVKHKAVIYKFTLFNDISNNLSCRSTPFNLLPEKLAG